MNKFLFSILFLVLGNAPVVFAHGLDIEVTFSFPAVISSSMYSTNQPAKNVKVSVFSPSDLEKPYQIGMTDQAGHFTFIPDVEGNWTIKADDGHGHLEEMTVMVTASFLNPVAEVTEEIQTVVPTPPESPKQDIPVIFKVIVGLSLIFGVTGFYYGIKAKQSAK
jgi:hypothetical protein